MSESVSVSPGPTAVGPGEARRVFGTDAAMLPVAGLTRLSSCDWPGRLVGTVFVQGCPWRCTYCHNPDLIDPRTPGVIDFSEVIQHLEQRHGLLDGVVFTGGEPTGAPSLPAAIAEVIDRGFPVGLHTSGAHPARLTAVLDLVSWVGLDIKGLPQEYPAITGRSRAGQQAYESLDHLLASGVDYEVRVTVDAAHHTTAGLTELVAMLRRRGVVKPVLQPVRVGSNGSTAAADALLDRCDLPEGVERRR